MLNIEWVSDYILTSTFKVKVGLTPVHCGHTCVQAGWTDVCPPWTLCCPTWFFSVILSQKEMIFLKDISQHNWSFNSLIFGNFIFSNFSNIYSGVGQTPVQPGQACVRWTIGCPCQGSQYCCKNPQVFAFFSKKGLGNWKVILKIEIEGLHISCHVIVC